ncbi:MAG: 6-hydroxymethylpterin diphosphokinase MptE-like protein [Gemmatimonadota bacterium]|nr:6-hydroxymethylpterin diphosphokinase MptE-like protein [Gemmatimonadota bacterium]
MDFLKTNITALARANSGLARRLKQTEPADIELIRTAAGVPSVRLKNAGGRSFTLHSTVNPLIEAERLVASQFKEGINACMVYGFGLGYHLDVLVKELPEEATLLVVEPQIAIFRMALKVRDMTHLLNDTRIFWAVGEDVNEVPAHFGEIFRVTTLEGFTIISHNPSLRLCGDYFELLDELCRKWIIAVGGNFLTNVQVVRKYLSNSLDNISAIIEHPPIRKLFGKFRGVPAVVVSAGPSLDRNIELLRRMESSAVIICVDTSLGPLHRAGITPHLVLAADASPQNFKHLDGLGETGAALVAEPMTHPRIVSEFAGDIFIMSFGENLMGRLKELMGDFGVVKAWGSISTGAFDLARLLGCDPIVFAGQDLSFPGGRYYAHGTYQERRWLRELGNQVTLDALHGRRMVNENNLEATDIFGCTVGTSKVLEAYRQYFEREIHETEARVINASEGGIGFRGVENMPLEEVLWRFARKKRPIRQIIRRARARRSDKEITRLLEFLEKNMAELQKMCTNCNEGFEISRKIHQELSKDFQTDLKAIEDIYEKIYSQKDILRMVENANQAGLLTFQREMEKVSSPVLDNGTAIKGARVYGAFFISFYQTTSFLKSAFKRAITSVSDRVHTGNKGTRQSNSLDKAS